MKTTVSLSGAIEEALSNLGLATVMMQARLAREWRKVAGEFLGPRTFPAGLKRGVLTIAVESHPLAQELTLEKPLLLARIREAVGEDAVRDIRFRVGPPPADAAAPRAPVPGVPPAKGRGPVPPEIGRIADPETREILLRVARRAALRRPPGEPGEGPD